MQDKIAFVCQRYGLEVNGGAELLCRQLAEELKDRYQVEVYTTCAMDYTTWANAYEPGTEEINGVTVHRFLSDRERTDAFHKVHTRIFTSAEHSDEDENEWLMEQGPVCPALLDALWEKRVDYRVIFFMTYLYYPTAMGMRRGFDNAVLIPTTHDEPPIYLRVYDEVFRGAKAFLWLTPEEQAFAEKRFPFVKGVPGTIGGAGVEVPEEEEPLPETLEEEKYIVYAGRIDESKGCDQLFRWFRAYKNVYGGDLKLALMGKAVLTVPEADDIVSLGFVSDELKFSVMRHALALVLFSKFESLSMVVLESMAVGRPVLVNRESEVLHGHCLRSGAGLSFATLPQFAEEIERLRNDRELYARMCENGPEYVAEHARWDAILKRIDGLIERF